MALLRVKDLYTSFITEHGQVQAVSGLDLEMQKAERVALLGETGCGKSILGLSIIGLLPENAKVMGEILFKGKNLVKCSREELRQIRGQGIMMIFQNPLSALNPVLTIEKQLLEPLIIHQGLSKREAKQKAFEILTLCKLEKNGDILRKYPFQFSGGELTRIMIALGIICQPSLLIADEPTRGLDREVQEQIHRLFNDICRKVSTTLLFITHDLHMVHSLAEKIGLMYAGEMVEYCAQKAFFRQALHPYTQAFLDAHPEGGMKPIPGNSPSLIELPSGCRFFKRCPEAMRICEKNRPPMREIEQGHLVRCFLYG